MRHGSRYSVRHGSELRYSRRRNTYVPIGDLASVFCNVESNFKNRGLWRRAAFQRLGHNAKSSFETIVDFQFVEDISEVSLDGFSADKDFFPDLIIRQSLSHQLQNLQF